MKSGFLCFYLFASLGLWAQSNPVPFVAEPLVPTSVSPGSPQFTLTVNGTGFVSGSVVNWNGQALTTQFISKSRLMAAIPASRVTKAGTASVTVVNPGSAHLTSNVAYFAVVAPVVSVAFSGSQLQNFAKYPVASIAADFNGDGIMDMAITTGWPDSSVDILLGKGDGSFRPAVAYHAGTSPGSMVTGDFNGDGKLDLVVLEGDGYVSKSLSLFLGNGDGTFQPALGVLAGGFQSAAVAGDFNGDGKLDLAVAEYGYLSILLGNGDGTFVRHQTVNNSSGICAGDFNGDGILDLAVAFSYYGQPVNDVHVFLGRGDGTFLNSVGYKTGEQDATGIACSDLSGDGVVDLIVGTTNGATVLLGNGDGTFGLGSTYITAPEVGHSLVVADFNGDGNLDVAVEDNGNFLANNISVLLGKGDGTLEAASYFQSGFGGFDLSAGDFNNDGAMDLAVPAGGNVYTPGYGFVSLQTNGSAILFSAATLEFTSPQLLGTRSATQSVTMTNVGKEQLDIAKIGLLGPNSLDFHQTNDCGTSLAIGAACRIDVTFAPKDRGWRATSLTVTANTITHNESIPLFGIATSVTLSPSSLSFGNQAVGTVSPPQTVTFTNVGNKPVSISSLGFIGQFPQVFLQTNNCGTTVAAGASCTINVQFAPKLKRGFIENFAVKDDGGGQMQEIPVSGTGT